MADQRITQLTALPKASVAATDVLPIADVSASQTKKVTVQDLVDAGLDLIDVASIDLDKLDQSSTTKLGSSALGTGSVTAGKLAASSSIAVSSAAPTADNFTGRGWLDSDDDSFSIYKAGVYTPVQVRDANLPSGVITTAKLADGAVTTAKVSALGTGALADNAVTYGKLQDTSTGNVILGRSASNGGDIEEIACTAAGRALLDDADAAAQRTTLGLGTLATQSGTFSGTHSGTTSGTNTGDQTITLTGDVTGSGTGTFAASIAAGAVTTAKVADGAISNAKLAARSVTASQLTDQATTIVTSSAPTGTGSFIGQGWLNTANNLAYRWDGTTWVREAGISTISVVDSTPIALAVSYPDAYSATLTTTLDNQAANLVWAGPTSGVDAAPTFRALQAADLPAATSTDKGAIVPGTGLSVSSGTLNHASSITAGTTSGITYNASGHITAAEPLVPSDIPVLDASKITTGEFSTTRLANDAVTAAKLANYSTAQIGETLPAADYIGQIFYNPLDKAFFLWDGNVWQPIGISAGAITFAGTYDASTNKVATVTTAGSAIGLSVGDALPGATNTNINYYVVVATGGTGAAPAPLVALNPPDLLLSNGTNWVEVDVSSTYISQNATNVAFSPAASLGSTNVQAALEEVSTECRNADNLNNGTVLAVRGGTGHNTYLKGDLLAASGTTALTKLGVGTNGQVLRANSATATGLEWSNDFVGTVTSVSGTAPVQVATGTTTPVISVTAASTSASGVVQLSNSVTTSSSTLAATSTAVKTAYDLADAALPKSGGVMAGNIELGMNLGIIFEGTVDDAFETFLIATNPTADRTINLPDASGVVALLGNLDDGTF